MSRNGDLSNSFRPAPTRFDLRFRLFGTPVCINPGFWIVHVTIGVMFGLIGDFLDTVIWISAVFVSVMIHEFGHVLAGWYFGARSEVFLTWFGGLADGCAEQFYRWQRIVVYSAGPMAQLIFAAILFLCLDKFAIPLSVDAALNAANNEPAKAARFLGWMMPVLVLIGINVVWPIFNLFPIPPLDGGMILSEFTSASPSHGRKGWEQDPDWWKKGRSD